MWWKDYDIEQSIEFSLVKIEKIRELLKLINIGSNEIYSTNIFDDYYDYNEHMTKWYTAAFDKYFSNTTYYNHLQYLIKYSSFNEQGDYDKRLEFYKILYSFIEYEVDNILIHFSNRDDKCVIHWLLEFKHRLRNTIVTNINFINNHYRNNTRNMDTKLSIELLNEDLDIIVSYLNGWKCEISEMTLVTSGDER